MIGNKRTRKSKSPKPKEDKSLTHDKEETKIFKTILGLKIDFNNLEIFSDSYYLRSKTKLDVRKIDSFEESVNDKLNKKPKNTKIKKVKTPKDEKTFKDKTKLKEKKIKSLKTLDKRPREKKSKDKRPKEKKSKDKKPKEKKYAIMTSKTKIEDENCIDFLETECKKTFCDKIHNFTLKFQEENNEEFARRYFPMYQDFSVLEPYMKKIFGNSSLDIMFLVDCTGSMSSWIDSVKNELNNIINYINDNNPHATIRVSFIGYRDFDCNKDSRYSILDFTEDINEAKKFISRVSAHGGGDSPEDVAGGLKKGLSMNWSENSAKYVVLICDCPCHGKKYHNTSDDYPNGDPEGLIPEDLIFEYGEKGIVFYGIKITQETDKMYEIFSKKYSESSNQPITIANLGHSTKDLGFLIAVAANTTLSSVTINNISLREFLNDMQKEASVTEFDNQFQTKLNNFVSRVNNIMTESEDVIKNDKLENENIELLDLKIEKLEPNFDEMNKNEILEAVCHTFYIKKDRHTNMNWKNPYIQSSNVKSKVSISKIPFSEGCNRYAFYMKDIDLDQNLVAKIPKNYKHIVNAESLKKELEAITICNHISNDFNNRIVNIVPNTKLLLNFIHCYIYEILNNDHKFKYYTVENYIPGDYVKYNNNAGWISENVTDQTLIAQAFSHFSWQITKGYLMVVDLQGVGGFLTDPQIHCLNPKKFGNGNFGYVGMMKYFMTHNCNKYCKQMELIHPKNRFTIDKDYKFFVDRYIPPSNNLKLYTLCDICREPYKANATDLYNNKKKCWENFCDSCNIKRKNSFRGATCCLCKSFFKSSSYIYKMKRVSFPDKCMKCKQLDTNEMRNEYYKQEYDDMEIF